VLRGCTNSRILDTNTHTHKHTHTHTLTHSHTHTHVCVCMYREGYTRLDLRGCTNSSSRVARFFVAPLPSLVQVWWCDTMHDDVTLYMMVLHYAWWCDTMYDDVTLCMMWPRPHCHRDRGHSWFRTWVRRLSDIRQASLSLSLTHTHTHTHSLSLSLSLSVLSLSLSSV